MEYFTVTLALFLTAGSRANEAEINTEATCSYCICLLTLLYFTFVIPEFNRFTEVNLFNSIFFFHSLRSIQISNIFPSLKSAPANYYFGPFFFSFKYVLFYITFFVNISVLFFLLLNLELLSIILISSVLICQS